MNKYVLFFYSFLLLTFSSFSQKNGRIIGNIQDKNTLERLIGVNISIEGTSLGTITDDTGRFNLMLPVGTYTVTASFLGYKTATLYNIELTSGNDRIINFEMEPESEALEGVVISYNRNTSVKTTDMITPLSVQQLTSQEIKSNPGGNFDVSKVVQTLPGVGLSNGVGERNDIIVRGGAPNENVYYLDGIEIPVLNHFQTQGSSGGAQGILNVSFIESLKLTTSAFDSKYSDALSSTFVIKQRNGNPDRFSGNVRVSLTETALTLEGPLSPKTTFLSSVRKSYLGLLFKIVDLPIRPDFYDFQYKVNHEFDNKTTLTAIGIGAIDNFSFAPTKESTPEDTYVLRSTPYINQWTYTTGFNLNRKIKNGYMNFALSRNMFHTTIDKYEDEQKIEQNRTLLINSNEIENKFRFDYNKFVNGWRFSSGLDAQYVTYSGDVFNKISNEIKDDTGTVISPERTIVFDSQIDFLKYGLFAQAAKRFYNDRLLLSGGIRSDMNSFTNTGKNPLKTLSPRLSASYGINEQWNLNGSIGTYFKAPIYTTLGFKDEAGNFINKDLEYTRSTHYVLGTEYLPNRSLRFTFEGYFKRYSDYPVSESTGVSLANQGTQFGSVGSERILSIGNGQAYGVEFFAQQKMTDRLFYVASYSYVVSKFSGSDSVLKRSSWDNRHLFSTTLGYQFNNNWDLGLKYRFAGGNPFTPFNMPASQQNYLLLGQGVPDVDLLNQNRLSNYNQLDLRVDKKFNFKKTSLVAYLDVQNLLIQKNESNPDYTFQRNADNTGFQTTDGQPIQMDGSNAIPVILDNKSGHPLPTIGIIFEF
ncbi:Vitamin B12 transporter BtuB [Arenibacter antarcticus]|uniref:TonB-dependent receptor domain-containing protein n=1 Tax=Arenibacter antarcticus TaxID=2040469 RepID=A0ABW5VDT1_9FLAO|nr:TonB-dependent receptor [Arenibacter sp. H213]MCM4169364.1 TonB-dependent receptor [Arenibacter sp. H213]